ncbi:putative 40S ribosomal protein S7 [Blattamonas nauphoetae]|uniref:40S ribosomal protein S7 n=1 Tax=Blattamonas nauphoetae TaxID=2049346 RepID=A0ABQ9XCH2_9EUKA|nr:putative 40S ribosomal protein S7 [Blattamonas nauphoetae]KAK2959365.1 putative 40S ribosomal protein S7 [Blattamonas nauphoetae]
MSQSREKLMKRKEVEPTKLELNIAQTFCDIEKSQSPIAKNIAPLRICAVREFEVSSNKKALVVFVPFPQLAAYHRVQTQLVQELEKKLTGNTVLIVAKRRIIPKPKRGTKYTQPRPRSRTVASVHEKILDDLVYPLNIQGKHIRHRVDGSEIVKVQFEKKSRDDIKDKLDCLSVVYHNLTGKNTAFEFTH